VQEIKQSYPALAELDLSNNRIQRLENLGTLSSLVRLDLSDNCINVLQVVDLRGLQNLRILLLKRNGTQSVLLESCADVDVLAPKLTTMDLAYNPLGSIAAIAGLKAFRGSLKHLTLTGSPLAFEEKYREEISHAFPWLEKLDGVELSHAPLNEKQLRDGRSEQLEFQHLEHSRAALRQEREMVLELLDRLEARRSEEAKQPQDDTVLGTRERETQAKFGVSSEAQTLTLRNTVGSQTKRHLRHVGAQTASLWIESTGTQTEDTMAQEIIARENEISKLCLEIDNNKRELAKYQEDMDSGKETIKRLREKLAACELQNSRLMNENLSLNKSLQKKGTAESVRREAMEKLIIAQENAILQMESPNTRGLLQEWRKKVFELMVKVKAQDLQTKRALQLRAHQNEALKRELDATNAQMMQSLESNERLMEKNKTSEEEEQRLRKWIAQHRTMAQNTKLLLVDMLPRILDSAKLVLPVTKKLSRLEDLIQNLNIKVEDAKVQTSILQNTKIREHRKRCELDRVVQQVQERIRQIQTRKTELEEKLLALRTENKAMMQREEELIEKVKFMETEGKQMLDETLEKINLESQRRIRTLEQEKMIVNDERTQLRRKVEMLQDELEKVQSSFQREVDGTKMYFEERLQRKEVEARNLRKERDALLDAFKDVERRGLLQKGVNIRKTQQEEESNRNDAIEVDDDDDDDDVEDEIMREIMQQVRQKKRCS